MSSNENFENHRKDRPRKALPFELSLPRSSLLLGNSSFAKVTANASENIASDDEFTRENVSLAEEKEGQSTHERPPHDPFHAPLPI